MLNFYFYSQVIQLSSYPGPHESRGHVAELRIAGKSYRTSCERISSKPQSFIICHVKFLRVIHASDVDDVSSVGSSAKIEHRALNVHNLDNDELNTSRLSDSKATQADDTNEFNFNSLPPPRFKP